MAETNRAASLRQANAARANGAKGGRPLGAKDSIPRKGTMAAKDREEALQAELGKALKREADKDRQIEDLRYQLNYGKHFPGDSKELLTAVYKAEYYATQEQIYAAKTLLDREYPQAQPGQYETDATGKVVLYLPHNHRDSLALHEDDANREALARDLDRMAREQHRKNDEQLHQWIADGKLTEEGALLCRGLWIEDGDHEWQPVKTGHATDTAVPHYLQYGGNPRQNGANATDDKSAAPEIPNVTLAQAGAQRQQNGSTQPQVQRVRLMYTHPGQEFETLAGKRYVADNGGEIIVDESDADELRERLGARDRR